jgi:hypothetical protein
MTAQVNDQSCAMRKSFGLFPPSPDDTKEICGKRQKNTRVTLGFSALRTVWRISLAGAPVRRSWEAGATGLLSKSLTSVV